MDKETVCACALNRVFGYEPKIALGLIRELGSASAVFDLPGDTLDSLLGPFSKYRGKLCRESVEKEEEELSALEKEGCRFIPFTHPDFPALLKEIEDPPAGLYYRGCSPPADIFGRKPAIAIVGTRDMSPYGKEWCAKIVASLAQAPSKAVIVSGLAYGIDITAHLSALRCNLPTVAVLPNGIDRVYPSAHREAASRIASTEGCALVTDYPPGTGPVAFTFLRRNRLIAALSQATILIESKIRGGGLMTCRLASGYGREVFALPGRLDDIRSQGCNLLIREKIAEPVAGLEAIGGQVGLGHYHLKGGDGLAQKLRDSYGGLPRERREELGKVAEAVRRNRGITVEEIGIMLGIPYPQAAALAGILQGDGIIAMDLLQRCSINAGNYLTL